MGGKLIISWASRAIRLVYLLPANKKIFNCPFVYTLFHLYLKRILNTPTTVHEVDKSSAQESWLIWIIFFHLAKPLLTPLLQGIYQPVKEL